jgi:CHAT domain-containing protein
MRAITDQLYLYTQDDRHRSPTVPTLADLQAHLDAETLLIAFYTDGKNLWAFSLDDQQLAVQQLPLAAEELKRLVSKKLVDNLEWALEFETDSTEVRGLTSSIRRMGEQLYRGLIAPLESRLGGRKRLVIVPFGVLHYLPFNLLRTPNGYLIEQYEIVILPSAALLTNPTPCRPRAARVLANTWDARLPLTTSEGQQVQNLFGGEFYSERAARYDVLQAPPCQILHIATHGEHRIHQPDFSYIQLADRQLFTDDLLQLDLSYELVTLSACETGRAQVAPGDELIGLGRGFLYAGAGALVASLWRVDETITVELMERMYRALRAGASKAAALQQAQRELLQREPELHPAFWSAFQLIGNPAPLSVQI